MLLNQFVVKTFRNEKNANTRESCGDGDAHDDCELQSALSCEANKRKNTNRNTNTRKIEIQTQGKIQIQIQGKIAMRMRPMIVNFKMH